MKRILCGLFLIILGFGINYFHSDNNVENSFKIADTIKVVRLYDDNESGIMCGNYIINKVDSMPTDEVVAVIITYNNNVNIKHLINDLSLRIKNIYYVDESKVLEGDILNGKVCGFNSFQIAISDRVIIGFPSIITGF